MECEECSSGSSSSNEQLSSPQTPSPTLVLNLSGCSPPSTTSDDVPALSPAKRKAGRKKFRETRHPVYRGVRERNGGKWVCELREPQKKTRIWLGTYATPEMAARAHDVAAIALRGKSAPLNFADSAWVLPRPRSTLAEDIRCAAAKAAEMFRPPSRAPYPSAPSQSSSRAPDPPVTADRTGEEEDSLAAAAAAASDAVSLPSSPPVPVPFVDEDALLNMAGLVDDMAKGLLMTPPAMHSRFDLDDMESSVDWSLWTD